MESRNRFFIKWAIFAVTSVLCAQIEGGVIIVDAVGTGDYPTIQAAIDAAVGGDEVVLQPGTYTGDGNRDIDFLGKAITIRSTDPGDPNVAEATVIDSEGAEGDRHRGFNFHSGEDANSVLAGLTITGGYATEGGGVLCGMSSPTISRCIIENNTAELGGGGICCKISNVRIHSCTVRGNVVGIMWTEAARGGGVLIQGGAPYVSGCIIALNRAEGEVVSYYEGEGQGGGIAFDGSLGGTVSHCTITGNYAAFWGGGVALLGSDAFIVGCIINHNHSAHGGGGYASDSSNPRIYSCLVVENFASYSGGFDGASATFINCTVAKNSATRWGGMRTSSPAVHNCIIWSNQADLYPNFIAYSSNADISYCNIQGGYSGIGNMDKDPCFADPGNGDYHVLPGSPCINAGSPVVFSPAGEFDIDEEIRVMGGRVDIGADEFTAELIPYMSISNMSLLFHANDHMLTSTQNITIRNAGGGTCQWEMVDECEWLSVIPSSGQLSGESVELALIAEANDLSPGYHEYDFTLRSAEASNSPAIISVQLLRDTTECLRSDSPAFNDWVALGRPECWCYPRQCHGDVDGRAEGNHVVGRYYVHYNDLSTLIAAWSVREPTAGPGMANFTAPNGVPGICADFARSRESSILGRFRVHFSDLTILLSSWNIKEPPHGPGIPGDCGGTLEP